MNDGPTAIYAHYDVFAVCGPALERSGYSVDNVLTDLERLITQCTAIHLTS